MKFDLVRTTSLLFIASVASLDCPPGLYLSGEGSCIECTAGTYSKSNSTACRKCPAGTESTVAGATTCADCQPGSYSTWGSVECTPCDRHTYSDHPRAVSCSVCPTGKYANSQGSTACDSEPYCFFVPTDEPMQLPKCLCPEHYTSPDPDSTCVYDPEFYTDGTPEQAQCQPLPLVRFECCPPGSFYDRRQGYASCSQCEAGKYSKTSGATACRVCPPGTAYASEGATTCSACQPGSFSLWGSTECTLCFRHTYSAEPNAVACSACPTGTYANSVGSSACDSAPYCKAGYSTRLRKGYADPRCLCGEQVTTPQTYCVFDPEFYKDGSIKLAHKACVGPWVFFLIDCIRLPCAPGSFLRYEEEDGSESCVKCPSGTYSTSEDMPSCRICPAGTESKIEGATTCADCQPGSYSTWGSNECTPCDRHTYSDHPKAVSCSACPEGKYANSSGSTACDSEPYCDSDAGYTTNLIELHGDPVCLCPERYIPEDQDPGCVYDPEFYIDGSPEQAQCQPLPMFHIECIKVCSPGSFFDRAHGSCTQCEKGKYSKTTGATACRKCPAGTESKGEGATTCTDCKPGSFSTWDSVECSPCYRHTYSNRPKAVSCAICPSGKYANSQGSTACNSEPYCKAGFGAKMTQLHGDPRGLCPKEYVLQDEGFELPCIYDPEFYIDGKPEQARREPIWYFQIECVSFLDCPAGTYSNPARQRCSKCCAGKFSSPGAKKCSRCPSGSFSRPNQYSNIGASACTVCPAGTSSYPRRRAYSLTGSIGCKACEPGKYAPEASKDCLLCPKGKFAGSAGSVACTACPTGKRAARAGSTACV